MGFRLKEDDFVCASQDLDSGSEFFSCKIYGYFLKLREDVVRLIKLQLGTGRSVLKCMFCQESRKFNVKKHEINVHDFFKTRLMLLYSRSDRCSMNWLDIVEKF